MLDREKVAKNLEECIEHIRFNEFEKIPFWGNCQMAMTDALALIDTQYKLILELQNLIMKILRKIVRRAMKALINLDYRLDPDRDELISILLGTKYDDHDFTLVVNRYL